MDGTGTIISRSPAAHWDQVRISLPASISRYVVHKGSIAVDGISLTVSALGPPGDEDTWFEVSLIPETLKRTTMGTRQPGEVVNLEVDVIAKYVERLLNREGPAVNQIFDDVDRAIKDIAEGRPVVVVDDADRENEGDIILAASMATPELLAFMIRYTSGVICVPLPGAELDRLHLPLMTSQNTEHMRTAFTLSVDARDGRDHGHLGRRPGHHHRPPGRPGDHRAGPGPPGAHIPAPLRRGRRAAQAGTHRGRGGPGPAGRAAGGGRARRGGERRRHHGPAARAARCSRTRTAWP